MTRRASSSRSSSPSSPSTATRSTAAPPCGSSMRGPTRGTGARVSMRVHTAAAAAARAHAGRRIVADAALLPCMCARAPARTQACTRTCAHLGMHPPVCTLRRACAHRTPCRSRHARTHALKRGSTHGTGACEHARAHHVYAQACTRTPGAARRHGLISTRTRTRVCCTASRLQCYDEL